MDNVEVTQADREAAADLIDAYWFGAGDTNDDMRRLAQSYRDGLTQGVWAQAFARHRLAERSDLVAEIERLRKALQAICDHHAEYEGSDSAAQYYADLACDTLKDTTHD